MAWRGRGFDMTIIYADPRRLTFEEESKFPAAYRSFEELLAESDFVFLALSNVVLTLILVVPSNRCAKAWQMSWWTTSLR